MNDAARQAWRWDAGALALYAALSGLFIDHGAPLTGRILGHGADPFAFIWFLAWFPYAVAQHLNPLWPHLAWQPLGQAVLWTSSVPLLAALAAPLTAAAGPVMTYNVLVLLAPVLAAWCMYRFCLCFADAAASVIGGFLFGFSTYEMAQAATLNLSFTCLLPCLGWIVAVRFQNGMGRCRAVALLAAAAVAQFLISIEIFATTILFGGIGWLLFLAVVPAWRPALIRLLIDVLIAGAVALLVLSPCLASMLASLDYTREPSLWPYFFAASPSGFLIPGQNTLLSWPALWRMTREFVGDFQEQDSYLGLPLLAIVYLWARADWRLPWVRASTALFLIVCVCSLGPHLWLGEHYTGIRLPWDVVKRMPLLGDALPVRFAVFAAFLAAVIAVLWMRAAPSRGRLLMGALACAAIAPAPRAVETVPDSVFFAPGRLQAALGANPQILILPFAINGASSYWQVENRFGFSQTGGYLGYPPAAMQAYPAVGELFGGDPDALLLDDFTRFVTATETRFVVAGPGTKPAMIAKLERLGWPERHVDDVTIFGVPGAPSHG